MRETISEKELNLMLYLHFCSNCQRLYILSGHRVICPACDHTIKELDTPYEHFIHLNLREREKILQACIKSSIAHSEHRT